MITLFYGLPRAGKSTGLAWAASCALRGRPATLGVFPWQKIRLGEFGPKYKRVYSNFPLRGCYKYDPQQLGRFDASGCLLLCDESSLVFYSRDYRTNDRTALDWLCLHGHYKTDLIFASQGIQDCDKRIRNLAAQIVHVRKVGGASILTPIAPDEMPDDPTKEEYVRGSLSESRLLRRKRFYHMFNSFDAPVLPEIPAELWYPES